jgi:hypothetical protein
MGNSVSQPEDNLTEIQKIKNILAADTETFSTKIGGANDVQDDEEAIRIQRQFIEDARIIDEQNRIAAENVLRDRHYGNLLIKAITEGNLEHLQQLINDRPPMVTFPISENDPRYMPIDLAIDKGNLPMIKYLRDIMKNFQN